MRFLLFISLLLLSFMVKANMASPVIDGTEAGNAFSSKDIEILKESIYVKIDKDFKTAQYKIIYYIQSDTSGVQIPLLFLARDFKEDFIVAIDNRRLQLLEVPISIFSAGDSLFSGFTHNFEFNGNEKDYQYLNVRWNENEYHTIFRSDLKYFKANISKGKHIITVSYTAIASLNRNDWVNKYYFNYALYPAKFWKRFGDLQISVDASAHSGKTFSNLWNIPLPPNCKKTFSFDSIPADNFEISFQPDLNFWAKALILIGPVSWMVFGGMILLMIHFNMLIKFRRNHPHAKRTWKLIAILFVFPFIILLSYPFIIRGIDIVIGEHASEYHGYDFLMVFFYPFLLPIYCLVVWVFDLFLKKKFTQSQAI